MSDKFDLDKLLIALINCILTQHLVFPANNTTKIMTYAKIISKTQNPQIIKCLLKEPTEFIVNFIHTIVCNSPLEELMEICFECKEKASNEAEYLKTMNELQLLYNFKQTDINDLIF